MIRLRVAQWGNVSLYVANAMNVLNKQCRLIKFTTCTCMEIIYGNKDRDFALPLLMFINDLDFS